MRYGSICSGIEAATVAWQPLGWEAAWLSEIEPFPCAVLDRHYPNVPNLGDITADDFATRAKALGDIDLIVGGTPCQAFSVAGLRRSLDDDRGNLTLRFVEICNDINPRFILWENVPGVLNTTDNAFGCFLAGIVGADAPLIPGQGQRWTNAGVVAGPQRSAAWRILDAQYFGLAQRRKRVFVVASAGNDPHPAQILFEQKGVCGDLAAGREEGAGAPGDVAACLNSGGNTGGFRTEPGEHLIPLLEVDKRCGKKADSRDGLGVGKPGDPMFTLQTGAQHGVAHALTASKTASGRHDPSQETYVVGVVGGGSSPATTDGEQMLALTGRRGDQTAIVFNAKQSGEGGAVAPTLRAMGADKSHPNAGGQLAVAFTESREDTRGVSMAVRRLTPL